MTRSTPEQIEELLQSQRKQSPPEPPQDLLERIHGEIPRYVAAVPEVEHPKQQPSPWTGRPMRLIAASLFIAVASTIVVTRVIRDEPELVPDHVAQEVPGRFESARQEVAGHEVSHQEVPSQKIPSQQVPSQGVAGEGAMPMAEQVNDPGVPSFSQDDRDPGEPVQTDSLRAMGYLDTGGASVTPSPVVDSAPGPEEAVADSSSDPSAAPPILEESGSTAEQPSARLHERARAEAGEQLGRKLSALSEADVERRARIHKRLDEPDAGIAAGMPEAEPPAQAEPLPVVIAAPAIEEVVWDARRRRPAPVGPTSGSTGGTAEPNDQPYGDVFFEPTGVNPFIDTEDDNLSTFGLDVDTGSYTVARRYLDDGNLPPAAAIRVEEFINYFDYGDPAPRQSDFAISMEGAPSPFADGPRYQILRFGIRARDIAPRERRPATLIFVVDTSGSMERGDRIGLVKRALMLLLDELEQDDRVGLVEYSDRARVLLEPTRDKIEVERALRLLEPHGSTNAEDGLVLGYELADEFYRRNGINRVILCSDGVANVGRTGPKAILEQIEREARRGIEITTVGFGMGNYNDVLMEQLADRGNGRYAYVDNLEEARRIFVENLTGTLQTIARDAKVQVDFNPAVVSRYRLLGYENRDIADRRFRDDSVDAGEIGAGHTVTALYEVKLHDGAGRRGELATLHLRWESSEDRRIREVDSTLRVEDLDRSWRRASPSLRLATVVAEFAEILKHSYWARDSSFDELVEHAERLEKELDDADVSELVDLMIQAARQARVHRSWDEE